MEPAFISNRNQVILVTQPFWLVGFDPGAGRICPVGDDIGITRYIRRGFAAWLVHELPCQDIAVFPVTIHEGRDIVSICGLARRIRVPGGFVAAEGVNVGLNSAQFREVVGEDDNYFQSPFLG